jgi:predicted metal-dependent hydrolase
VEKFIRQTQPWLRKKLAQAKSLKSFPAGTGSARHFEQHKEKARKFILGRVALWNSSLKLPYESVRIGKQTSRWGSCSKKGNLSFNYRLFFVPAQLADYVVVHELCHLKHFDHSRNFWNSVACAIPDYKTRRKELKKYALS